MPASKPNPGPGRPALPPHERRICLRATVERGTLEAIDRWAEAQGMNRSRAVEALLTKAMEYRR